MKVRFINLETWRNLTFVLPIVTIALGLVLLFTKSTSALSISEIPPTSVRQYLENYDTGNAGNCYNASNWEDPAFDRWAAPISYPDQDLAIKPYQANYGTQSITLAFNHVMFFCKNYYNNKEVVSLHNDGYNPHDGSLSSNGLVQWGTYVKAIHSISITGGYSVKQIDGLAGAEPIVSVGSSANTRYFFTQTSQNQTWFKVDFNQPIVSTADLSITIDYTEAVEWAGGVYACVLPHGSSNGSRSVDYSLQHVCPTYPYTFNIHITVPSVQVQGRVFELNTATGTIQNISNATITNCDGITATTDSGGVYSIYMPSDQACSWTVTQASTGQYDGPHDRPWGFVYKACGPFGGNYTNPDPNYCTDSSLTDYNNNLAINSHQVSGYDFVYVYSPTDSFRVLSLPRPSLSLTPLGDSPNQVTIDPSTINVRLSGTAPMQLNGLTYTGTYYVAKASGGTSSIATDTQTLNFPVVNSSPGISSTATASKSYTVSNLKTGDEVCAQYSVSPATGNMESPNWTPINGSGVANSPSPATCVTVSNLPYARFYGNNVMTGVQFKNSHLACDSGPNITADNNSDNQRASGSGGQFAVMSTGQIQDFASAFLRSALPVSPTGLTFANVGSGIGHWGGNFSSGSSSCPQIENYYTTNLPSSRGPMSVPNGYLLNSLSSSILWLQPPAGGYIEFQPPGNITGDYTVIINGSVDIPSDITVANSGHFDFTSGQFAGLSSLLVIVLGNIYVNGGVNHLDGVYVAENQCDTQAPAISCGGSYDPHHGGEINTCGQGSLVGSDLTTSGNPDGHYPSPSSSPSFYDDCNHQLEVTGALVAHEVKLNRTYGSIRNSVAIRASGATAREDPFEGNNYDCSNGNTGIMPSHSNLGCSAEVFNFNPLTDLGQFTSTTPSNFDAINSLPPVVSY